MLGAICGDIIGSAWEFGGTKSTDFPLFSQHSRFTDDTVLTVATAFAVLNDVPFERAYHEYANRYPRAGYAGRFKRWSQSRDMAPYDSWGNGSAMRVSPMGWVAESAEHALSLGRDSAAVTHSHPRGIVGAQAVALAIFLARQGADKPAIRDAVEALSGYDLRRTIASIRPEYEFDVSCDGSVPEAIVAFLEASSLEDAIRLAISLGGDADTQGAIAGSIAEAFYGPVPDAIEQPARALLPQEFNDVVDQFRERYMLKPTGETA